MASTRPTLQLDISLIYTMADGRGALPPPLGGVNPSPRAGEVPAGVKKAAFPPKIPLPINPSPYGAAPPKLSPKMPSSAPPKSLPPQPVPTSTVPSGSTPSFAAGPKKMMYRQNVPPTGPSSAVGTGETSPRLPSPRDAALPRPLPPMGGAKPATLPPQLTDAPVQLPPPIPSQMWPEAARSSPRSAMDESDSNEEVAALAQGVSNVKKAPKRKPSTGSNPSKSSDGSKSARREKRSGSVADLADSSALGPGWDPVYNDFEKNLKSDPSAVLPASDDTIEILPLHAPDLPASVKILQGTIAKGAQKLPFYVQETLDFYTAPPKTITHLTEEYGKKFQFKERAAAASLFVGDGAQTTARESLDSSSASLSANDSQDPSRPSSGNSRHPSQNTIDARRSSKTPPVMGMLARSSSVTSNTPNSSTGNLTITGRSARSGSGNQPTPTITVPPTQTAAGQANFPHSPKGTQNMLSSWLSADTNSRNEERGRRNRRPLSDPQHIFQTLDAMSLVADSTEVELPNGMPLKPRLPPNHLLVRCKALAWNFAPNCEVLQCTISLHDVAQRIKLSEDFHFDFIEEMEQGVLTAMLPEILGASLHEISPTQARRALFPLSYRSGSVYMLVRIRAALKADTEEGFEPYVATGRLKDPQRWMDSCAKSVRHLGHLRQPLAWGAVQVFNDASRFLLHDDSQIKLYRMRPALDDETFYDTITSTEKMKLLKQLEGSLSLSGFLYTPEKYHLQNLLDPHLTPCNKFEQLAGSSTPVSSPPQTSARVNHHTPAASNTSASSASSRTVIPDLVKEVREFAQPFHQVYPNATYENQLYIYPLQVDVRNASKIKVKSVAVRTFLMSHEGVPDRDSVQAIHGASHSPNFVTSWTTTVDLEEKSPLFFDEVKMALPVRLTDTFHLYFQVYAINPKAIDPKKNKHSELKVETLIGTAWVPLFRDNKFFKDGTYTIGVQPVMDTGAPPAGYLDMDLLNASTEDKMTITFRSRLVSSIYTTSEHLARFYSGVIKSGDDYLRALEELAMVPDNEILFRFAPLLNFLFSMLCTPKLAEKLKVSEKNKKEVITRTFLAIADLASKITVLTMVTGVHSGISEELLMYVSCHFDPYTHALNNPTLPSSPTPVPFAGGSASAGPNGAANASGAKEDISFQAIASAWVKVLKNGTSDLKSMSKTANGTLALGSTTRLASISVQELGWFFLSLIIRSLSLKINERKEAGTDDLNRNKRYSEKFSKSLTSLISLSHDLRRMSKAGFEFFNRMLARFITDLYRYMDRGFVSHLVSLYLSELDKDGRAANAFYRFKFLQEIAEFEHYVGLNLPSVRPLDMMIGSSCNANGALTASTASAAELRLLFWKTHFLAGHLINEFRTLLQLGEEGRLTRIKSISKLRDLLWRHTVDPRYTSAGEPWQQRLASMYFPLASLAFEHLDTLLGATSGLGVATSTASTSPEWKDWCYVVTWILRHCNRDIVLRSWRATLRPNGVVKFFKFLRLCHETFAKPLAIANASLSGAQQSLASLASPSSTSASSGFGSTPMYSPSPSMGGSMSTLPFLANAGGLGGSSSSVPGSGSPAFGQSASGGLSGSGNVSGSSVPPLNASAMATAAAVQSFAANTPSPSGTPPNFSSNPNGLNNAQLLVNEMVLTLVDAADHFIDGYESQLSQSNFAKAFSELASLIVNLLRSPTSSLATCATIGLARFFCISLRKPLFRDTSTSTSCSDLCSELLLLCQQQHPQVMASATAVLYLMIKENYAEMGDFSKMRRHSTVALSNVLKNSLSPGRLEDLGKAFEAMETYSDASLAPGFKEQVKALISGHRAILRDCARVEQFSLDFLDLKVEYSYNIANAYRDCPELRVQWLVEMAKLFEKGERWEEAGMCRLQAASLVGQYLSMHPMTPATLYHAIGINNSSFLRLAPELLTNEPPIGPTLPISASWFTEESLLTTLLDACHNFAKAEQFESAIDAFTLYCQVCMDTRKYPYVAQYGSLMQDWATKADKAIRSQSRIPSNFYRVGFYGNEFGADNGKEYIYKAPPAQRLADFSEKLVARYSSSFAVEVLNNKPISEQTLQPGRHYVQIVNLEPYFEVDVNKEISWLDRTRNVKRFYFETSYSPDGGRPSEDVAKMYKRRELVTARLAFPNFFLRSAVEKKESIILQPYDCALDLMVALTAKLKAALNCVPIVAKNLQIILQGAVLAQVNAGPAAIIANFLSNSDEHPTEAVEKLRESMRAFIRACNFGLILNKKLIEDQPDTAALQEAMMSAFATLQAEASKYIEL